MFVIRTLYHVFLLSVYVGSDFACMSSSANPPSNPLLSGYCQENDNVKLITTLGLSTVLLLAVSARFLVRSQLISRVIRLIRFVVRASFLVYIIILIFSRQYATLWMVWLIIYSLGEGISIYLALHYFFEVTVVQTEYQPDGLELLILGDTHTVAPPQAEENEVPFIIKAYQLFVTPVEDAATVDDKDIFLCAICLAKFQLKTDNASRSVLVLELAGCGHMFHDACLQHWNQTCPLCRNEISRVPLDDPVSSIVSC